MSQTDPIPKAAADEFAQFAEFDDSLFEGMKVDADEYAEHAKSEGGDFNTLFYLGDGEIVFRAWPELYYPQGEKKLRLVRVMRSHTIPGVGRLACRGEGCRFCVETKKLYDIKYKEAYKTAGKDEGILTGYVYSSTMDKKYVKLETPAYVVMRKRPLIQLQSWLGSLDVADLKSVFNPMKPALGIKLDITGGNQGNASIGFAPKTYELPELPATFESGGMGRVFYDENSPDYGTEEDLQKYKKYVAEIVANKTNLASVSAADAADNPGNQRPAKLASGAKGGNSEDRVKEMLKGGIPAGQTAAIVAGKTDDAPIVDEIAPDPALKVKPVVKAPAAKPDAEVVTAALKKTGPKLPDCPGKTTVPALDFGKHDETETECAICPLEAKCKAYTEKLKGQTS